VISLERIIAMMPYTKAIENQTSLDGIDLNNISVSKLMDEVKKRQVILA
jgi:hypothetical protein